MPVARNVAPENAKSCKVRRVDDPVEGHLEIVEVDPAVFLPGSVLIVRSQLTDDARAGLQVRLVVVAIFMIFGLLHCASIAHGWPA